MIVIGAVAGWAAGVLAAWLLTAAHILGPDWVGAGIVLGYTGPIVGMFAAYALTHAWGRRRRRERRYLTAMYRAAAERDHYKTVVLPARIRSATSEINQHLGHLLPDGLRFEWTDDDAVG